MVYLLSLDGLDSLQDQLPVFSLAKHLASMAGTCVYMCTVAVAYFRMLFFTKIVTDVFKASLFPLQSDTCTSLQSETSVIPLVYIGWF